MGVDCYNESTAMTISTTLHMLIGIKLQTWPRWLQIVVMIPHAALIAVLLWVWWPKTSREWRWFGALLAYAVVFYLIFIR
jgi:hypothetical protein